MSASDPTGPGSRENGTGPSRQGAESETSAMGEIGDPHSARGRGPGRSWVFWLLAIVIPLIAFQQGFAGDRLFYLRDLSFYFWPEHLWLRDTLLSGQSPFWDPYVEFGRPAVADPVRHLFFLPVLALRLLLPAEIGFNLSVAIPFSIASSGMFWLLRSRTSDGGALLGALTFACSGPVLSTGNTLNMAWALSLTPWILACAQRLGSSTGRGWFAVLAFLFAQQFCAGEAVVLLSTAVLAVCFAAVFSNGGGTGAKIRSALRTTAAGLTGLLLAAPLALPMAESVASSDRTNANAQVTSLGSLDPASLVETVFPFLFGDFARYGAGPWLLALNDGLSPFLVSIYLGVGLLTLAVIGAAAGPRRWSVFWGAVLVVAVVLALGNHTPIYSGLQNLSSSFRALRFPSKFLLLVPLALGALVAPAWEALVHRRLQPSVRRAVAIAATLCGVVAATALIAITVRAVAPGAMRQAIVSLAAALGVADSGLAVESLHNSLTWGLPRSLALSGAVVLLMCVARTGQRAARFAPILLAITAVADPLFTNAHVNPVMQADFIREPGWLDAVRANPQSRIYVASRLWSPASSRLVDGPRKTASREDRGLSAMAEQATSSIQFATFPSAWHLRDGVSFDNAGMRPREHGQLVAMMRDLDRDARMQLLGRLGVRYFVLSDPPTPDSQVVAQVPGFENLRVYEGPEPLPRAFVAPSARVEPDLERQMSVFSEAAFDPTSLVLLDREPPPAVGRPGAATDPGARIVDDGEAEVIVRASAPAGGGFMVLLDSFDDDWSATVDGSQAPLLRANGVFRAVRIAEGEHIVRFRYEPREFWWGVAISTAAAALIAVFIVWPRRRIRV